MGLLLLDFLLSSFAWRSFCSRDAEQMCYSLVLARCSFRDVVRGVQGF